MGAVPGPNLLRPRSGEKMSSSYQVFNFFPQLDAIICSVSMIPIEFTILG